MIDIIFTGGTIGSRRAADGYISAVNNNESAGITVSPAALNVHGVKDMEETYMLIKYYRDKYDFNSAEKFRTHEPYCILSEQLNLGYVQILAECIRGILEQGTEGIIITHGTDTLPYMAGFLYYLFPEVKVPIVLVSSAYVLDDSRSNGLNNFKIALDFIKQNIGKEEDDEDYFPNKGVYVAYQSSDGRMLVHTGNMLCPSLPYSSDVHSINDMYYAKWVLDRFMLNNCYFNPIYSVDIKNSGFVHGKVLKLTPYPGMIYPDLDQAETIKAVLLDTYHSGTICIDDKIKAFAAKAKSQGIPLYLAGLASDAPMYETVKSYDEMGIEVLYDMSPIAAYCMLTVGL